MDVERAKKTILFGAALFNWSETQRMVEFAAELHKRGYRIVFLGEGKYDYLIEDRSFIIRERLQADRDWYTPKRIAQMLAMDKVGNQYASASEIDTVVAEELRLIQKYQPCAIVTGYRMTLTLSARISGVKLVWCLSAVLSKHYLAAKEVGSSGDSYRQSKEWMKNLPYQQARAMYADRLMRERAIRTNGTSKQWNQCLKQHGAALLQSDMELFEGDLNLMSDAAELFPSLPQIAGRYQFIGPIFNSEIIPIPDVLRPFLKKEYPRKKVLVSVGSGGKKEILMTALHALESVDCEVFVSVIGALEEDELAAFPERYHFCEKFPLIEMAQLCDAAIIQGGQGTLYAMLEGGCPFVSIPGTFEQRNNVENLLCQLECGKILYPYELSATNLTDSITDVLEKPEYSLGAQKGQAIVDRYYTEVRAEVTAADRIEEMIEG